MDYCHATAQLNSYLAECDQFDALRDAAHDDNCRSYLDDAIEQLKDDQVSERDWEILCDTGDIRLVSQEAVWVLHDLAHELAEKDVYKRYEYDPASMLDYDIYYE